MARYLGNYEILGELGKGTTGMVYKARKHDSDQLVAVKILLPKCFRSSASAARVASRESATRPKSRWS